MNQLAQPAVVAAVGDGFLKRGIEAAAQPTERFIVFAGERGQVQEPFSADGADFSRNGANRQKAVIADWQSGNIDEGGAAQTTIGRKEGGEQTFGDAANRRDQRSRQGAMLRFRFGPRGPSWVPTTAEDEPPSSGRCYGDSTRTNLPQYNGGMQCGAIAANGSGGGALCGRTNLGPLSYHYKTWPVVAPKTIAAAHGSQTQQRENMSLEETSGA